MTGTMTGSTGEFTATEGGTVNDALIIFESAGAGGKGAGVTSSVNTVKSSGVTI